VHRQESEARVPCRRKHMARQYTRCLPNLRDSASHTGIEAIGAIEITRLIGM